MCCLFTVRRKFHHGSLDEIATVITDFIVLSAVSDANKREKSPTLNLRNISLKNRDTRELKRVEKDLRGTLREGKRARKLQPGKAFKSNNTKHLLDIYEGDDWTVNHAGSIRGRQWGRVCTWTELFLPQGLIKGIGSDQAVNILNSVVPVQWDRNDVSVEQVRSTSKHLNQREATGSDNLSAFILCSIDTHMLLEMWKNLHTPSKESMPLGTQWWSSCCLKKKCGSAAHVSVCV